MENTFSLKSYYQLSYVSVWLTGILLTIVNILMKGSKVHFHLALGWSYFYDSSNAAWLLWWLKQSIKLCKLKESIVAITNTSWVYLLTCVWVLCFLKVQKFNLSPTLALNYAKATRSRVVLVSTLSFLNLDFTYDIKGTSWKRCYLVTSSRLIHTYFTIQGSFLLIYKQELKSGKVTSFFPSQLTCERRSLFQDIT